MQLAKITISNFKGLRSETFEPTRFSCLVGENNAGKSTVLQAIVAALNRPTQLQPDIFYDQGAAVEFRMTLSGIGDADLRRLAEEHRPKIAELVIDGDLILIVRYRVSQKIEIKVERLQAREERYKDDAISAVFAGKKGPAVRKALADNYPEFTDGAPEAPNITGAKEYLAACIARLPRDQFVSEESPLPSGVSQSISALLPEPIYIPAVKNLTDDLKTSQSTSFGRLLGLLLDDMASDLVNITASLQQLNDFFNRVERDGAVVDNRHDKVKRLEFIG